MGSEHFEALLQRIDTAIERSEWCVVVELAEQALAVEPENPDAQGALRLAKRQLARAEEVGPDSLPPEIPSQGVESFIGRHEEISTLQSALERAIDGSGGIVMITGEPGIGKSRIAQEISTWAESQGVLALTGRNSEDTGAPPYWPWIQAFESYRWDEHRKHLSKALGSALVLLAPLMTGVSTVETSNESSTDANAAEQARFRFYNTTARFLVEASRLEPILLVLEDLHWADESSLGLLEHVAAELSHSHTLVIGTYRDVELSRHHRLYRTLAELTREQLMQRIALRRLSRNETSAFLNRATHIETPEHWTEMLYERSEGNPLFAIELVRWLDRPGRELGEARVPEGIREVIGRRLNRLSATAEKVLQMAGVLGLHFRFDQLITIFSELGDDEISEDNIVDAIEELAEAGFIGEEEAGLHNFSHALIREVVTGELSLTRRARLHAQVAQALERHYGDSADSYADELADHFSKAETVLGPEKLVRYSLLAGEQALSSLAHEHAAAHFRRGLEAAGEQFDAETRGLFHLGLGKAHYFIDNYWPPRSAMKHLVEAFDILRECGNNAKAVEAAGYVHYFQPETYYDAMELAEPESPEAVKLMILYAYTLYPEWDPEYTERELDFEKSEQTYERALGIAKRHDMLALQSRLYAFWHRSLYAKCDFHGAIEKGQLAIETAAQAGVIVFPTLRNLFLALTWFGSADEATRVAEQVLAEAQQLPVRNQRLALIWMSLAGVARGEWEAARALEFPRRSNRGREIEDPVHARFALQRIRLHVETGETEAARGLLEELIRTEEGISESRRGMSRSRLILGMIEFDRVTGANEYTERAESLADWVSENYRSSWLHSPWHAILVRANAAVLRSDAKGAARLYRTVRDEYLHPREFFEYPDHILGRLALTAGDIELALEHLEKAHRFLDEGGWRPHCAWAGFDWAEALLARGAKEDREKAHELLAETQEMARALGMPPLLGRCTKLLGKVPSPKKRKENPDGLTEREVEVLRLVALGFTDHEVAEKLFISPKTASNHVSNILRKTHSANRTEAATYAAKAGMLDPEP